MSDTQALRTLSDSRPSRLRSAVTNGSRLFVAGDGRSPWARRYRDLIGGHVADMGGPESVSAGQASLIRRAAALEIECERLEGQMASGEPVDVDVFARVAGHLRRILETLGLERRARNTPSLDDVLAAETGEAAEP